MDQQPPEEVLYAKLLPRFKALVFDLGLYVASMVLFVLVVSAVHARPLIIGTYLAWMGVLLLYEPIMVWRLGGTLGHMRQNLRIASERTGRNPGLGASLLRWLAKGTLGVLSFFFIALTQRHQALHDTVSGTTVRVRDAAHRKAEDFVSQRTGPIGPPDVSAGRRILVILGYQVGILFVTGSASLVLISEACALYDRCTDGDDVASSVLGWGWMLLTGITVVMGWKGRLVGARSRER